MDWTKMVQKFGPAAGFPEYGNWPENSLTGKEFDLLKFFKRLKNDSLTWRNKKCMKRQYVGIQLEGLEKKK